MSIAEARRSMKEAESVAKSTELAFIFIPLSLAASLFSMQIKELKNEPPFAYFFGTAVGMICFAYAVRGIVGACFPILGLHSNFRWDSSNPLGIPLETRARRWVCGHDSNHCCATGPGTAAFCWFPASKGHEAA
jgi:hypothetical protein